MKKTIAFWCCLLILVYCLPLFASAHSGRTDGDGGHYDRDTGEYHYHHGYPAHDHWDMDGDGDIDCPYEFKDNTSHSNGLVSSSSNKNNASVPQSEEKTEVPAFVYWIIGILTIVIICMYITIRGKNKTIEENERSFKLRQADEEAKIKEGINALHKALISKYGEDYLCTISGVPEGDYIGDDMLPHSSGAKNSIYLDQYTFYLGSPPYGSDVKYHHTSCRYARSAYPINAMHLKERNRFKPCMVCPCRLPDTKWVKEYQKHSEFLNRYIDKKPVKSDSGVKVNYRGRP